MVELVRYIVEELVEEKESVQITSELQNNVEVITIKVAEKDVGRVIGRQGRVATAIRAISKAVGIKEGKHYSIEIAD